MHTAYVARVAGLMFLVTIRLVDCFWLVLLLAFRKNAVNQRQHLCAFGGGQLCNVVHQLLAQIGADRIAVAMRACIIGTVCGCFGWCGRCHDYLLYVGRWRGAWLMPSAGRWVFA